MILDHMLNHLFSGGGNDDDSGGDFYSVSMSQGGLVFSFGSGGGVGPMQFRTPARYDDGQQGPNSIAI